jgi:hypothetical protein
MKQFDSTKFPKHQAGRKNMVRGFYEASSKTEFAAAIINDIGYSFWVQKSSDAHDF